MKPTFERYCNIAFALIFALAAFWLLGFDGANYLRKIDLLSIFIATPEYFSDCAAYPGGILVWCATFLTQTFYYPVLGAVVYILFMLPMAWLAQAAFGLRRALFPATLLMPALALLALLNFGYIIFSLKSPGFAFVLPLAVDICLLAFWGYRKIPHWGLRLAVLVCASIAGYCLLGFYGLLLTAMCAAYEIANAVPNQQRNWLHVLLAAVLGAVGIILVPKLWFWTIGGDLSLSLIYKYPLPYFYENEGAMWTPYIILFLLMLISSAFPALRRPSTNAQAVSKPMAIAIAAVGVIAIAGIFAFRYTDRNFKMTLDLDHALSQGQLDKAMEIVWDNQDIEPTRANVALSIIAMQKMRCAPQQMFKIRMASAPYNTTRDLRATHDVIAMPLAYHTGLANYAYRWAMEYEVEYGRSVERLQYLVKSALLNKDYALARKSLDNLSKTTFHKKWAEKYYRYLDDPQLIKQDAELGAILPLVGSEDKFLDDHNQLEGYVWKALASIDKGQFEAIELALTSSLICFRLDLFAEVAPLYAQNVKDLPLHFQEAVLMWSLINQNDYYRPFKIDKSVMQRFAIFKDMLKQTSNWPAEVRKEKMQQMFGDTYWYYCMFVNDLKVI